MITMTIGGGASRLEYNGLVSSSATASTITFLNVPLGDANASRRIYIALATAGDNAPSVTIGGSAMTEEVPGGTDTRSLSIWSRAVPTGTSATVVVNYGSVTGGGHAVFSYSAYDQQSTTRVARASPARTLGTTVNASVNTAENGFVIGVSCSDGSSSGWTGLTTNGSVTISGNILKAASASYVPAATPRSITATESGATTNAAATLSMP